MQLSQTANQGLVDPEARSHWKWSRSRARMLFALVFLLAAVYMAKNLKRGWVPMDEGTFGLSAEHVLEGQLPHRDYLEGYTGGLTYLNAFAFRIFGANSASTRYVLYLFFLAWIPAFYYFARKFVSAPVASALTLLAVAWGPPNYSAAMPSWYNLFFATFGLAALSRYIEVQNSRWIIIAGLCGGISFLFKQTGLFFIAAILLFLFFREQVADTETPSDHRRPHLYRVFLCVVVLVYEAFLLDLVLRTRSIGSLFYFLMPGSLLGVVILWHEFACPNNRDQRFTFVFHEVMPFAIGVAIPVAVFLAPFVCAHALADFLYGVFVLPGKRFTHAAIAPSLLKFAVGAVANAVVIFGVFLAPPKPRKWAIWLALLLMPIGLLLACITPFVYKAVWGTIWVLLPTLVVAGLVILVRGSRMKERSKEGFQRLFLVLCVAALCGLVQLPFVVPVYYCYVAPLVVLAAAAVISSVHYRPRLFLVGGYCFVLFYALFEVTPGFVYPMGQKYEADTQTVMVNLPHTGGLRTFSTRARTYEALNTIIGQHAHSRYILATPDCPEMYFLYGFHDPMRSFFDFLDEPKNRTDRILAMLDEYHIDLVVLNGDPLFSGPVPTDLRMALEQKFPNHAEAGSFEVRWKE